LLEEPSGGLRGEIRELINQVVYIDVPQDLCVIRLVERLMDMEVWRSAGTFDGVSKEDLVRQLNAVAAWTTHYQRARQMYFLGSRMAHKNADIVVDGMRTVDEIANEVLNAIETRVNSI
jgi:uridine kinase